MLTGVLVSAQRAKSGLGEAAGGSVDGKGGKAHSILSSHLQSGGRKNSITGVTKRHLSKPPPPVSADACSDSSCHSQQISLQVMLLATQKLNITLRCRLEGHIQSLA